VPRRKDPQRGQEILCSMPPANNTFMVAETLLPGSASKYSCKACAITDPLKGEYVKFACTLTANTVVNKCVGVGNKVWDILDSRQPTTVTALMALMKTRRVTARSLSMFRGL
jgi:hypothetical protein